MNSPQFTLEKRMKAQNSERNIWVTSYECWWVGWFWLRPEPQQSVEDSETHTEGPADPSAPPVVVACWALALHKKKRFSLSIQLHQNKCAKFLHCWTNKHVINGTQYTNKFTLVISSCFFLVCQNVHCPAIEIKRAFLYNTFNTTLVNSFCTGRHFFAAGKEEKTWMSSIWCLNFNQSTNLKVRNHS